jgi:NADPH:quinone reductase-like Zn-dependent oxidoreductase
LVLSTPVEDTVVEREFIVATRLMEGFGKEDRLNQIALITGGGGGIGGAVAQRMAGAGIVVVVADYDHAAANTV